jgi:hypothetical protein
VKRNTIAITIIAIWIVGLALLYRRNTTSTPEQALAEVGMRISPATYYYTLMQGDKQVGAASSSIDTSKTRVIVSDFVRGEIPVGPDVLKMEARSQARFTRGMRLRDFIVQATGDMTPFVIRGVMQEGEEKTLRVTAENKGERAITTEAIALKPVFLPSMAGLPLMLTRNPKIGDTTRVSIYDPVARKLHEVTMRVEADSLFLVADSASLDSASGRWIKARQDSMRGWRITGKTSPLTAWVDASGRVIAASEPGGITMVRTAFEMAFENWRLDHPASSHVRKRANK